MPPPEMRVRDFLLAVREAARPLLEGDLANWRDRQRFALLQFLPYEDGIIHYEVWVQRKTGRMEIGLHFEGPREFSYAWAAALAERAPEVAAAAGPGYELEEWTASWTRLHRTWPLPEMTPQSAAEVARRLVKLMRGTAPLLRELAPVIGLPVRRPA